MSAENDLISKLSSLNHIAETLNQAVDVRSVLDDTLADLVDLMGLQTAWIWLDEESNLQSPRPDGCALAAHHNLPPALDPDNREVWAGPCACQGLCATGHLTEAYNEVHCSRLARAPGDRRGLAVHASAPLRSGDKVLGILNVAAPDWTSFSPQALSFLTNVGSQLGIALERARLYDLLREQRIHEQAALLQFSNQLLRRLDLDDLMDYLVEEVRAMLHADASALLLPGDVPGSLEFRAASGWRVDPSPARQQVPDNDESGPGVVMRTQKPLLVEDLQADDPAPWQPHWVQDEGFRSHALVPLLAEERSIGVLVIDQRRPGCLQPDDLRFLQLMANQAAIAVEKGRLHEEEVRMQALEKELELGRRIQLSLLPTAPPAVDGWEIAVFYEAAKVVGGDFYDIFDLPNAPERLGLAIADVTGKGIPAALFMARVSSILRTVALRELDPSAALGYVNELIMRDGQPELFLTASYAQLDTATGRLTYATAGHPRPLWIQAVTGQVQELNASGIILGAFRSIELEQVQSEMAPGDVLVLYTDGVTEAMDSRRRLFGLKRLCAALKAHAGATAQEIVAAIVDAVQTFAGATAPSDDLTVLVVRRAPLST